MKNAIELPQARMFYTERILHLNYERCITKYLSHKKYGLPAMHYGC